MLLDPLTQFVRKLVLSRGGRIRRKLRRTAQHHSRRQSSGGFGTFPAAPAELLEERALLSGPQLITIAPNTGGFISNGQVQTEAPRELTFTFSPGASINANTLNAISVTRSGGDGLFGTSDDQNVALGHLGIGSQNNQVTLRFADTLPDDVYRVTITGALKNTQGESFNSGVTQNVDFRVDYGTQIVAVVPQPVLRGLNLSVANLAKITDGDTFTIEAGGAPVRFQFKNTATSSTVAAGNIGILYNGSDTATTLATKIASAINNASSGLNGVVSANQNGTSVGLTGAAFSPVVKLNTSQTGFLSLSDGALVQRKNQVTVYFNQNALNANLAQDPAFYQLINSSTGQVLLASQVKYNASTHNAVLTFAADLPTATYQLKIGAPVAAQNTLNSAVNAGTLFSNTGGYTVNGFLGNANKVSTDLKDVDLYRFQTAAATNVTINASDLASGLGSNVILRLFTANGTLVGTSNSNSLVVNGLNANSTYYVGVSASGNANYNPVTGAGTTNGVGFGGYELSIAVSNTLIPSNGNTTSFGNATNLGNLGAAGQSITDQIAPLGNLAYPPLPGGSDEPGHRDIGDMVDGESNGGGTGNTPVIPGSLRTYFYNFKDIYGTDPQGNVLHNAITENQKQRAREIMDMYASYLGVQFVETDSTGITIVTGDVRAADSSLPPDALGGVFSGNLVIINANLNHGNSEYGGGWFNIAFHEIGHSLGLEHSYDAPSVMGSGLGGVEPVYPGDINLVPAMRINPPTSTDINLYKFQTSQAGTLTAETIAQRIKDISGGDNPSLLDGVITVYQEVAGVRTIIARNDDYFGRDSFVNLHLEAGTYYVAITSTGNTNFDPTVADSGFGGRTQGTYQLKLNFTPDAPTTTTLNDAAGVPLDGDADAAAGGVFNFWFQSGNTIFVDKASTSGIQDGSAANPYTTIAAALAAAEQAGPGTILRIVGNGGTDGSVGSIADNKAYLIGFDTQGNAAADGSTFKVPKGVTVMIDAGAIIKLKGAIIDVGATVPNVDRDGGALQVLGTPDKQVYFTSLSNDAIGNRTDPTNFTGPQAGNWGGLVFRQKSDVQGKDYRGQGIYLNSVIQSNFTYGGGQVFDDSVLQVFNPIHVANPDKDADFFARPAIWNNTITLSADAAISADPNSFANTLDRSGPDIHGNRIIGNSINGVFIRIRTELGEPVDKLEVPARIDDSDIVYVLPENLLIAGTPGGPRLSNGVWDARVAGGLIIDPGVILKLSGSRIEAQIGGSQLIAEGTASHPIIFTSLRDDTFGAGGTFDTGDDGATTGVAGQWGGLFFNSTSSGSLDRVILQFAGGTTPIAGGFADFNAVEIQQALVRITNSLFQFNADGDAGGDNRNGLLSNGPATIFVRGAQPVIVGNIFRNNQGNALSINANALNSLQVTDWGRSTGALEAYNQFVNNKGALVRLNRMQGNGTNGMEVRGEIITTETIWDDTDIVHVLRTEIRDTVNLHSFGGIRLQSSAEESLVIKLQGANAGFTINGLPLDIDDRIGGTLQVVGSPGHPVIFTSLADDTVGAGFLPNGQPLKDTNGDGNASTPQPGDWRSIILDKYSNDTNMAVALEAEGVATGLDSNGTPSAAEFLGALAPSQASDNSNNKKGGNDDQPLGFEVHGYLSRPTDNDVYSFNGQGGTEVWIDIGRTSSSLDTVVELIDANGNVLAASDNSQDGSLTGAALGMIKDPLLGGDFFTTNPKDAGFRVVLPGQAGSNGTYFIRVKSKDAKTSGEYQLQVRIQQVYMHPGSTVRYSDIRYATNGIEIRGLPENSLLGGTSTSNGVNNSFANAQALGNLLTSNTNTISVSGSLANSGQVDWYKFNLNYDLIQSIGGVNGADKVFAAIFDIDYADGIARPDLTISVFDESGRLILISRDSNVNDDQPGPLQGNGLNDLSRGSVGKLDPYIGSAFMPAGPPPSGGPNSGSPKTYFVAISSNTRLPQALDASVTAGATNPLIRLEPISSIQRIVEDHIGFTGYTSGSPLTGGAAVEPTTPPLLPIDTIANLQLNVRQFTLSDVTMFVNAGSRLQTLDAHNGTFGMDVGQTSGGVFPVSNIQFRSDGTLWGIEDDFSGAQNTAGRLIRIDPATGAQTVIGSDQIPDFDPAANPANPNQLSTSQTDSFLWIRNDVGNYDLYYAVHDGGGLYNNGSGASRLYRANPANGSAAVVQGQPWGVRGEIVTTAIGTSDTNIGFTTGMALVNGQVFGVSSGGKLFTINLGNGRASLVRDYSSLGLRFSGLSNGPQNLSGGLPGTPSTTGYFADKLFAMTEDGRVFAMDTSGNLLPVFANGATSSATGFAGSRGISFSPLDFNLWHPTMTRSTDAGHGINATFDNTRPGPGAWRNTINGRDSTEASGGASFYFGLENWVNNPVPNNYFTYGANAQYGILQSNYHQDLTSNAGVTGIGNNYNLPGGAHGSLVTGAFNLAGYTYTQKPTLYFNYFLDTENANSATVMRDSARVYITADDGVNWTELATNQSVRSTPADPLRELPQYATTSASENTNSPYNQRTQELFDNTGGWRQARIDLGEFAGRSNLKLRFDFSTAGTSIKNNADEDLAGDEAGVGPHDNRRGLDNNHVGFYIDDIIIGLAGRGEMVTGGNSGQNTFFAPNPGIETDPFAPKQTLTGAYQLEIRRGTPYGGTASGTSSAVVVTQQFDVSDRMVTGWSLQAPSGAAIVDGQTLTITDGLKTVTFEFDLNGALNNPANFGISFSNSDSDVLIARKVRDAINTAGTAGLFTVSASLGDDTISGTLSTNSRVDIYGATNVTSVVNTPTLVATTSSATVDETGSVTVTLTRQGSTAGPLQVTLEAIDAATGQLATGVVFSNNQATINVTIPTGQSSANFVLSGVNDLLALGTRTILVRPTAAGFTSVLTPVDLIDQETPALSLTIQAGQSSRVEGQTGTITVRRNTPSNTALLVTLASLNLGEISVPATVLIPAGQDFATFDFTTLQDGIVDGQKLVDVAAYASGFVPATATVTVNDSAIAYPVPSAGPNVNISGAAGNQFNGAIAIDRTNGQNLFAVMNTVGGGLLAAVSSNGGVNWTTRTIATGTTEPAASTDQAPVVVADSFGNLFLAYVSSTTQQIIVLKSNNFGATFTPAGTINTSNIFGASELTMTTGSGALWVGFRDGGLQKLVVSGAQVNGLNSVGAFGGLQLVPTSDNGHFADLSIGPNGQLLVAFQSGFSSGGNTIFTALDADGLGAGGFPLNSTPVASTNVGWQDTIPAQNTFTGVNAGISLAWDRTGGAHNGRLYMVYTSESPDETNQLDVLLRFSTDNGATWSAAQRVNDDTGLNSQFMPRLSIDQTTGNLAITWLDARNDLGAGGVGDSNGVVNDEVSLFGAIVTYQNGILTIGANAKIASGLSNAALASNPNAGYGVHTGLDFHNGILRPIWSDNSLTLPGNPTVLPIRNFDVATSTVVLGNPAPLPRLSVTLAPPAVAENGVFSTGTVTRTGDTSLALIVALSNSDPTRALMPGTVTIPAGQLTANFTVTIIDNNVAGGTQSVLIRPGAAGYQATAAILPISDNEVPALTVVANTSFGFEGTTITGTVTRNTPLDQPLTVFLTSADSSEISVPISVVIPAGQSSVNFIITIVNDFQDDSSQTVEFIASAPGMRSSKSSVFVIDSNIQSIERITRLGDRNVPRQQGSLQISSNTIRDVSEFGIKLTPGQRDGWTADANLPHPGSAINGPTLNNERLVPGPQIANNVIYNFGQGGIQFSGDPNAAGQAVAAAPYGRIVNNTIHGGTTARGTGILVTNNAAPTILNNIVSNTATGISVDGSSAARTVVGTTLFKGNTANGTLGTNSIVLGAAQPLFVNALTGNFYLAEGSLAIDSSLNTLQDRPSIVAVKSPLGIPQSPISAPTLDRFGQLRVDDPFVPNAGGLGQNIFKDRGAVERADFVGPSAKLATPLDNEVGVDGDPDVGEFFMTTPQDLTQIEIEFNDQGIGIDNATVVPGAFTLTQDGVALVEGVDYIFTYNANTRRVAFLSVSVFPAKSTYVVTVDTTAIRDQAGNTLQGNQPNGTSRFTIVGNDRPNLTSISTFQGLKNIPLEITYAQLLAASNLTVVTGHTAQFRIESVVTGTLTILKSGQAVAVPVVPGTTLLEAGDKLIWTPVAGNTGITAAFNVVGFDPENAVIAPALSTSANPVAVNVNLVNLAPTLTTISTLPGTTEDTTYSISYNTLLAASNIADQNNDTPLQFRIQNISSGTLSISVGGNPATPVIPGVTLFGPGSTLLWTPPSNANSTKNAGPFGAFTVVATDGNAASSNPVSVPIDVAAVPDLPRLTTINPLGLAGLNSTFRITFADLLAASDATNVDGHANNFQIQAISAGTLQIRRAGSPANEAVVPGTTVFSAGDILYWTPPANQSGSNLPAFTVVNYDAFNATNFPSLAKSTTVVQVGVNVSDQPSPSLTSISTLTAPRFVPTTITYNQLANNSNASVPPGHAASFIIDSITSGSLTLTRNGTTSAVVAGVTIVQPGDSLTWNSPAGASGLNGAFAVRAIDQATTLTSLDAVQVNVNLVNVAPVLSSIATLQSTLQQQPFSISYATLKGNSNVSDANNDALSFRIESVLNNGTLQITKSGTNTAGAVVAGVTRVEAGDTLTWTPGNGVNGASVGAFTVVAFDGTAVSSPAVQVNVNVVAFGSQFDITGPWLVNGKLTRINQNGGTLTFVDENGTGSSGGYTTLSQIVGRGGLTGVIDLTTADQGRITWSDGAVWTRIALGGQYYNPANGGLTAVFQQGIQLTFVNVVGGTTNGTFLNSNTVSIAGWGQTVTIDNGFLKFSGGGQWKKLNISPEYTNASGDRVQIRQNGSTTLQFVNKSGSSTNGNWISPTQFVVPAWGVTGKSVDGVIEWSNGTFWYKNLTIFGTGGGSGVVSLSNIGTQVIATNKAGGTSRVQLTSSNTLRLSDWGVNGQVNNGKIFWSNGTVWDNFDFNALDSIFIDIRRFPFGA